MREFDLFIGSWRLQYDVPESFFSPQTSGEGEGTFAEILNGHCVTFGYEAHFANESAAAHGIFVRNNQQNTFRYWWFEDSGNYDRATCKFLNKHSLFLVWRGSALIQTFEQINPDHIELKMFDPRENLSHELILKVDLYRKSEAVI